MGWTYFEKPHGKSTAEILQREWPELRFHAHAMKGTTFYAAVESQREPGVIFGLVVLTDRSGSRFGYKDMVEGMGPYESECPLPVLNKLTPTKSEWANEWRERCRQYWSGRQQPAAVEIAEGITQIDLNHPQAFQTLFGLLGSDGL